VNSWTLLAGIVVLILAIGLITVFLPVWLPLDYVLRCTGRNGFVRFAPDGYHFSLEFTPEAFRQ
jgi:hypothetical protein